MNMNNLLSKIFFAALLVVSFSCSDFLDEKPRTNLTTNVYFNTPEQARSLINSLYRDGASRYYHPTDVFSGFPVMYGGFISGLFDNQDAQAPFIQYMQHLNHNADNIRTQLETVWDYAYGYSITRANTAIKYIPDIPGLTDVERAHLLGEARFFRAFAYLYLVRFFGDVPLILEPYESLEDLYVARTASEKVYAQIIEDATEAAKGLNDQAFTENGFRVTKAAAETVLANAYLQMSGYPLQLTDNYKNAASAARSVIQAQKHGLIEHIDGDQQSAYNILRTEDNSKEYIYSREYAAGYEDNGPLCQYSMPIEMTGADKNMIRTILMNVYKPSDILLNAFDPEDLRIQEKQFWYNSYTYININGEEETMQFSQTVTWRFYDYDGLYVTTQSSKDITIYRYPEILLIAAEAIARSEGVTSEAASYLAEVRSRGYNYPGSTSGITKESIITQLQTLSQQEFVEEVWTERLRELAIDFKIWDDIQRTRKYPQTSASNPGNVEWIDVIGAKNPFGATYKSEHLLFPISTDELQRNPALEQNDGF